MLERLELLVGNQNIEKIINKHVLIIGVGGVGGYTVESLARCGIKHITIVDYDTIDVTNLNRQIIALNSTIGEYKADAFKKRIEDINPLCKVDIIKEKITEETVSKLFVYKPDYIVDACDTISVKKELIRQCIKNKVKIISSMGTGNKLDPSKLEIKDIRKTSYDPIAKIIRKMVKDERIKEKIPVVCSEEVPIKTNSKTIASISFVPAAAGLLLTSYIINDILGDNNESK